MHSPFCFIGNCDAFPIKQKALRGMRTRAKKKYVASDRARRENVPRHILFYFTGNCVAFPVKQKALRVDRTAAERNLSLRDPPQAENPAEQDSIFTGFYFIDMCAIIKRVGLKAYK